MEAVGNYTQTFRGWGQRVGFGCVCGGQRVGLGQRVGFGFQLVRGSRLEPLVWVWVSVWGLGQRVGFRFGSACGAWVCVTHALPLTLTLTLGQRVELDFPHADAPVQVKPAHPTPTRLGVWVRQRV